MTYVVFDTVWNAITGFPLLTSMFHLHTAPAGNECQDDHNREESPWY